MKILLAVFLLTFSIVHLSCNKSSKSTLVETTGAEALTSPIPVIADWETGNTSQWRGIVGPDVSNQFYIGTSSAVPVRQGTYAARFTVRPGDTTAGISGERCEADMSKAGINNYTLETHGDEYYYGWSTYFPTTWTNPTGWGIFMQFHHNNTINPPISFNAHDGLIGVNIWTGHVTGTSGSLTFAHKDYDTLLTTLNKGLWNDFIVFVKFRLDWQGKIEVWHRLQGQAEFTKIYSKSTIPTMQWFDNNNFSTDTTFTYNSTWRYTKIWLRNGLYRGKGGTNTNTIIHDNFNRADNYAAVRATFP